MTSRRLLEVPISELSFEDIEALIRDEAEEDLRFELKRELPANAGQTDAWMQGGRKINNPARDGLAKEIVALANAYGGVVVVGVDETDDQPKRARGPDPLLIPRVSECAERLLQALDGIIDPPLPVLEVRGIPKPGGEGEGVLVLRTGPSTRAPHGFGRPPLAYMRRGSRSEPMTMRDLQSTLFETRTRGERVRALLEERRRALTGVVEKGPENFTLERGEQPFAGRMVIYFRCTLVAGEDLQLKAYEFVKTERIIRPTERYSAYGDGMFHHVWRPRLNGAESLDYGSTYFSNWFIGDYGIVDAYGFLTLTEYRGHNDVFVPGQFTQVAAQVLALGEFLRRAAKRPEAELVIESEFINPAQATAFIGKPGFFETGTRVPQGSIRIGPFSLGNIEDFQTTYTELERGIWHGLGMPVYSPVTIDIARWLTEMGDT